MLKGKTKSGFEFEVDEAVFDDWELIEDLEQSGENAYAQIRAVKRVLGNGEQYARAKEFCRDASGHVKSDKMIHILTDIIEVANAKNS